MKKLQPRSLKSSIKFRSPPQLTDYVFLLTQNKNKKQQTFNSSLISSFWSMQQMTDARCSRCSGLAGVRDIIHAGHGDRYQVIMLLSNRLISKTY